MNITKELRRLVREALVTDGGTGGRRHCRYCLRQSFEGQLEHYRKLPQESSDHCAVDVMKAAIKQLSGLAASPRRPGASE